MLFNRTSEYLCNAKDNRALFLGESWIPNDTFECVAQQTPCVHALVGKGNVRAYSAEIA